MHNRGVEGHKQYILPALSALVLTVLLVARNMGGHSAQGPAASPEAEAPAPDAAAKSTKAAIQEAVSAAGDPPLGDDVRPALASSLAPVVERCRASRPDAAGLEVRVAVDVLAARGIGVVIERAELEGELPPALVGCVREGMLSAKPGDIGKTGRLHTTLEYPAS